MERRRERKQSWKERTKASVAESSMNGVNQQIVGYSGGETFARKCKKGPSVPLKMIIAPQFLASMNGINQQILGIQWGTHFCKEVQFFGQSHYSGLTMPTFCSFWVVMKSALFRDLEKNAKLWWSKK